MKNLIYYSKPYCFISSKLQLILLLTIISVNNSLSQTNTNTIGGIEENIETDLPTIIPPSPTVATLMRFEEVPVNHYTGVPDISLSLYLAKLSNNLNLNIGLSYNPSGVRVDERSGWTGTGWSLNTESVISRTVMDVPDEISTVSGIGDYGVGDIGTFSNNFYELTNLDIANASQTEYDELSEFVWETTNGVQHQDYQPDLFQFSFFGYAGRFIILNINGNLEPKIISSDKNIKINLNYTTNNASTAEDAYILNSFEVIDPHGNKFLFSDKEITHSESYLHSRSQSDKFTQFGNITSPQLLDYTSSWKLTEIRSSSNQLLANYQYHDVLEVFTTAKNREVARLTGTNGQTPASLLGSMKHSNASLMPPKNITKGSNLTIQSKKLQQITLKDLTKISFSKENNHPEFTNFTSCKLTGITIEDFNGNEIKDFYFIYHTNPQGRLFLDRIHDISNQSTILPYKMFYENRDELPEFENENKDIWGYYNGINDFYNASHYEAKAKTGVLNSLSYPTGGKKEFDFELNKIGYVGQSLVNVFNLPENNVMVLPPNQSFYGDLIGNGMTVPLPQRLFFEVTSNTSGEITYNTVGVISNQIDYNKHDVRLSKVTLNNNVTNPQSENDISSETFVRNFDLQDNNNPIVDNVSLSPGWYMIKVYTSQQYIIAPPDPTLPDNVNHTMLSVYVTMRYGTFQYNTRNLRGGGLRIKSIRFTDQENDMIKTDFDYSLKETDTSFGNPLPSGNLSDPNLQLSSGAFEGSIMMKRTYTKNMNLITPVDCSAGLGVINLGNPIPTSYSFEVTRILNAVSGQMTKGNYVGYKNVTVTKTGNGKTDYEFTNSLDYPTYDQSYYTSTPPYFETPVPDLEHKKGLLIKQSVFNESGDILKKTENEYVFDEIAEYDYFYTYYQSNCPSDMFFSYYQNYKSGTADIEICAIDSGIGDTQNCGSFPGYIGIQNAKHIWGKTYLNKTDNYEYFYDDTSSSVKESSAIYQYNADNFQISQVTNSFEESGIIQDLVSKYFYPVGPDINSNSISVRQKLVDLHQINELVATQSFRNGTQLNQSHKVFFEYSTDQLLPQVIEVGKGADDPEARIEFHKYDNFNNPLEFSKAEGTRVIFVWGYNDSQPIAKIIGHSYDNISSSLLTVINAAKSASNNDSNISTENFLKTKLDDIRNHSDLVDAQVTTLTYDPLIGVTSVTDPRGFSMTYHYDDFNRLKYVKDQDGNILSENEYNYRNQY
ncbi:hypothetical protein [Psychroserpens damuponensis]|uniref:hypothetical protein n=1 Tax=Psychroserpens damuponensis TaxID=943936 RepID=UPI00058D4CCC|nr:hypothetical protein [Psychroserpens damuponensis]